MRRFALIWLLALCPLLVPAPAGAQQRVILSIASGNTGGVFYPLAGGMAGVLSRQLPGWQVTAEVTGGSIDNLRLVVALQHLRRT